MKSLPIILISALAITSCQTTDPYTGERKNSNASTGAVLGGLVGAGVGALTGSGSDQRKRRALRGAGIGVLTGGGVGLYMDNQEAALRRELQGTGVSVTRSGDQIHLNMPGDITFATNSASINGNFYPTLNSVAKVLVKFNKTLVDITGHTDSTGARSYNYTLSKRRAGSVANYLQSRRVNAGRFNVVGRGPDQPIASNGSSSGKAKNRRVTIQLSPVKG